MTETKPAPARLPLYFKALRAFDTLEHRQLRFPASRRAFPHAHSHLVPVTIGEVGHVLRHYPILFLEDVDGVAVVALTGLQPGQNHFIDASGVWRSGCYIPSFVRGYPFATLRVSPEAEPILAFDPTAPEFAASDGEALVDAEGRPTELLTHIIAFQKEFRLLAERTVACAGALRQAGVLEPGQMQVRRPTAEGELSPAQQIEGFLVASEARLRELPAETLKELMQSGALGLAYAHLLSLGSLSHVIEASPPAPELAPARKKRTLKKQPK